MAENVQALIEADKAAQAQLAAARQAVVQHGLPAIEQAAARVRAALTAAMTADWPYKWDEAGTVIVKRDGWFASWLETMAASPMVATPAAAAPAAAVAPPAPGVLSWAGPFLRTAALMAFAVAISGGGAGLKGCGGWLPDVRWPDHIPAPFPHGARTPAYAQGAANAKALPARLGPVFVRTAAAIRRGDDFASAHADHVAGLKAAGFTPAGMPAGDPFVAQLEAIIPAGTAAPTMAARALYADALRDFGLGLQGLPPEPPGPVLPAPTPAPSPSPAPTPAPSPIPPKPDNDDGFIRTPAPAVSAKGAAKSGTKADGPTESQFLDLLREAEGHEVNGRVAFAAGRYDEAEGEFGRAVEYSPAWGLARFERGSVRYTQGRFREAAEDFAEVLRRNPDYPGARDAWRLSERAATSGPSGQTRVTQ